MISHVLDTCAVLDLAAGRWKDEQAKAELASAPDPVILSVSVWEIARKLRVGRLNLPCRQDEVLEFVEALCERHQIRLIWLSPEVCHTAELLPPLHEDPFDRMIIAQGIRDSCPVFTTDRQFLSYPVRVMMQR